MGNWIIDFDSLGGEALEVTIGNTLTNRVPLGASVVLETNENDDEDWFVPVRTQTGYIRIYDDGTDANGASLDWTDIIPATGASNAVTISDGNSHDVLWRGFMQAQTFGGRWNEYGQEREYPIYCQLSALACYDVTTTNSGSVNFAGLLYHIFNNHGTWSGRFYFQGEDAVNSWLKKRTLWANFTETDDENIVRPKYNCLELLEEICKFFGWTCRMSGENVFFCSADEPFSTAWSSVDLSDLNSMSGGWSAQYQTHSWDNGSLSVDKMASTDNVVTYLRGWRKATVMGGVSPVDNVAISYPDDELSKTMENMGYTWFSYGNDKYLFRTYDVMTFEHPEMCGICSSVSNVPYGTFNLEERFNGDYLAHEEDQWAGVINIKKTESTRGGLVPARLWVPKDVLFGPGYLKLSGGIYRGFDTLSDACTMLVRVGIGQDRGVAMWWDGSVWTSSMSSFTVRIGRNVGIYHNSSSFGTSTPAAIPTVKIPISGVIYGKLFIDFLGSNDVPPDNNGECSFCISDFAATFESNASRNKNTNMYIGNNYSHFSETRSVDLIFASYKDNAPGLGIIMNDDGSYCEVLPYTGNFQSATERPEEHLAERIAARGSGIKRMLNLEVRTSEMGMVDPSSFITIDNVAYWVVSIGYDWRNDVERLKLIEL